MRAHVGTTRKVVKPTKAQLSRTRHKAMRGRAIAKPKVAFVPCSTALPEQAPRRKRAAAGREGLAADTDYLWPVGATLNVHFTDGSLEARKAVAEVASQWSEHANLKLAFFFDTDAPPPVTHIRVRFDDPGCNSALGTSSQYMIDRGDASMRLCHIDSMVGTDRFARVVIHEFGHAIGMNHEHQSPKAKFEWDKPFVYQYYRDTAGWDAAFVDQWVFRQISGENIAASDYDADSVMQYEFPPEFTKDRRAIRGSHELSALDKTWAAKVYPRGKPDAPKSKTRFYERAIAVRNGTGVALDVQLVHEGKRGKGWAWTPGVAVDHAPTIALAVGAELVVPDARGRKLKVLARSRDGKQSWSGAAKTPLVIATSKGYVDRELQTWVVAIEGPADAVSLSRDDLYAAGTNALDAGDFPLARARFGEFVKRFPDDAWGPWAELSLVIASIGAREWSSALGESYTLAVERPGTDAAAYAWYYGGLAAMQLGKCDDARQWFDFVVDPASGLASEWRDAAKDNLAAMRVDPRSWCD
ncbi:MAG: outer membrane protein assembly factor BamD [Deltaproteobacteria bacterium]|nr:outer membrane protein assembly factor BamD [Nannocystaceae bacterium]